MTDQISSAAAFYMDDATGILRDISSSITSLDISGGNALVDNTGLGQSVRSEIRDIGLINTMRVAFKVNSTTEPIFAPLLDGTSVQKTVQAQLISGQYISGESYVGPVAFSIPIGLQTGTAEFHSTGGSGFDRTSVAL